MADVEMKALEEKKEEEREKEEVAPPPSPVAEIKSNAGLIERAVNTLEPRFTHRVLRTLTALRKKLDDKVLYDAITEVYPAGACSLFPVTLTFRVLPATNSTQRILCKERTIEMDSYPNI